MKLSSNNKQPGQEQDTVNTEARVDMQTRKKKENMQTKVNMETKNKKKDNTKSVGLSEWEHSTTSSVDNTDLEVI